jgi:predicted enzyme related to lactoylglutathione lyase
LRHIHPIAKELCMRSTSSLATLLLLILASIPAVTIQAKAPAASTPPNPAVGAQYDTTHVYVAPADFDALVSSLLATFGGTKSKQGVFTVTPTPSETMSQLVLTPAGSVSVFGFKTPIPYPFGVERTGYLVGNLDTAVKQARLDGADVIVAPFPDPIGRDVVIQWPGGVNMQLYWHTTAPSYPKLQTVPENRVYLSPGKADEFVRSFVRFSHGRILVDEKSASGADIGRPGDTYRAIRIESAFGKLTVLVTDGHLPYPYGRELTGYEVSDLPSTLDKATASGAKILVPAFTSGGRQSAVVEFPGGYIAEIHAAAGP